MSETVDSSSESSSPLASLGDVSNSPSREDILRGFEEGFRAAGLVSFCRRPHVRPTVFIFFAAAFVLAIELVLALPSDSWTLAPRLAIGALAATLAWWAARVLQRVEYTVSRPATRLLAEGTFLLVPPAVLLLFADLSTVFSVALVNLGLLFFYVVEESMGLRFVLRWAVVFAWRRLRGTWRTTLRAVPVLTVVLFAMFAAGETWQIANNISLANFASLGLLLLLGTILAANTGLQTSHSLLRKERVNITALASVATGTVAVATALAFAGFLLLVGSLVVDEGLLLEWVGEVPSAKLDLVVSLTLSLVHVKIALLMGALAGFVFSAALGGNESYRELSNEALQAEVSSALKNRESYLYILEHGASLKNS